MNKKTILHISSIIAVLIILAFGIVWAIYKTSPTHTLVQVKNAVQNQDYLTFEEYFDVDQFSKNLSDDLMKYLVKESNPEENNLWSGLGNALISGMSEALKPLVVSATKNQIEQLVKKGIAVDSTHKDTVVTSQYIIRSLSNPKLKIKRVKNNAIVAFNIDHQEYDTSTTIKLKLNSDNGTWKIVAWENALEYVEYLKDVERILNKERNAEIRKKMAEVMSFEFDTMAIRDGRYSWESNKIAIQVKITNKTKLPIHSYAADVFIKDPQGNVIKTIRVSDQEVLAATKSTYTAWQDDIEQTEGEIGLVSSNAQGYTADILPVLIDYPREILELLEEE